MSDHTYPSFSAPVIPGIQRGRKLGVPTFNLSLEDVPSGLLHGIYACYVKLDDDAETFPAVMHFGQRPVFNDTESCEVHVIGKTVDRKPARLSVAVVEHIRDVEDYPMPEVLQEQMKSDIAVARAILGMSP